ncbi:hypothetical protein DNK47_02970 [Mycoplasma wenyonii]|uniref:Uncharacterized protein n=1 Tax=Mycoplasma wenyonii TaxID=65123 RepID=A0A328PR72_9MOLU|nr:hypothetical protein [Mycoplasma wenyonii]RAO94827.1 hypothetical protein DNK47_02970 [Mycoplasma wenyonii]
MALIPFLSSLIVTCGFMAGVYAPLSFAFLDTNSISSVSKIIYSPEKLSVTDPVLGCNEHERNYKVYLVVSEEGEKDWTKESAKDKVTFKVVDVNGGEKIVWGLGVQEDNKLSNWKLRFGDNMEVKLNVPQEGSAFSDSNYQAITCQDKKIERELSDRGREVTVSAEKEGHSGSTILKVEVDQKRCTDKSNENKEECEIKLVQGLNLKWTEDFKPKAIFPKSSKK